MKKVTISLDELTNIFRKAEPSDIIENNIVYLIGDDEILHKRIIEEVYNPKSPWKAFCANDGCRYGLEDLYVLKDNSHLHNEIYKLTKTLEKVSNILKEIDL